MSTRSVIARPVGDEWEGRYHHFDGYPTGVGKTLWDLVQARGLEWTRRTLLDEHTGWSTINGVDWSLAPGFSESGGRCAHPRCTRPRWEHDKVKHEYRARPACYCHGDRSEEGWTIRPADDTDTEWCYVLGNNGMTVYERDYQRGATPEQWVLVGSYEWHGAEPDWETLDKGVLSCS